MNGNGEVLKAILSLHEATEMRFNAVDAKFAAQDTRLDRLERDMREGFDSMRTQFAGVQAQFVEMHAQFAGVQAQFRGVHTQLDDLRAGLAGVNQRLDRVELQRP